MILDKIYCPEEQRERAEKALKLNGFTGPDNPLITKVKAKPTVRIKRLVSGPKLKGASSLQSQRQGQLYGTSGNQSFQEHLASCELCRRVEQMAGANKVMKLLTGL